MSFRPGRARTAPSSWMPTACAGATGSSPSRCPTSSRCAATRRTGCPAPGASARRRRGTCWACTGRSRARSLGRWAKATRVAAALREDADQLRVFREIARLRRHLRPDQAVRPSGRRAVGAHRARPRRLTPDQGTAPRQGAHRLEPKRPTQDDRVRLLAARPRPADSRQTRALRPGKVLIDWSQNDQHKTTVCVYSLRARDRPTVSTPVEWDEVRSALASGDPHDLAFDAVQVLDRVSMRGDLLAPVQVLPPATRA